MNSKNNNLIAASSVESFENCLKRFFIKYRGNTTFRTIENEENNITKKNLGLISHRIVELYLLDRITDNLLYDDILNLVLEINKESKEKINELYFDSMDGEEFILTQNTLLKNLQKIKDLNNEYEINTEFTYSESFPFKGQADIVLRNNTESLIIDYKSAYLTSSFKNIEPRVIKQLYVYYYLESKQFNNKNIKLYVLDKYGDLEKVEVDKDTIAEFVKTTSLNLSKIENLIQNTGNTGSSEVCNNCIYAGFCDDFKGDEVSLNERNVIFGKVKLKKDKKNYLEVQIVNSEYENNINVLIVKDINQRLIFESVNENDLIVLNNIRVKELSANGNTRHIIPKKFMNLTMKT